MIFIDLISISKLFNIYRFKVVLKFSFNFIDSRCLDLCFSTIIGVWILIDLHFYVCVCCSYYLRLCLWSILICVCLTNNFFFLFWGHLCLFLVWEILVLINFFWMWGWVWISGLWSIFFNFFDWRGWWISEFGWWRWWCGWWINLGIFIFLSLKYYEFVSYIFNSFMGLKMINFLDFRLKDKKKKNIYIYMSLWVWI